MKPMAQVRDAATMRALSHPARYAVLEHLLLGNTATATELAEVSGLSPSATSYHLRELAKVNLIEEAPSRGDGRERVWRTPIRGFDIEAGPNASDEERAAERDVTEMFLDLEESWTHDWLERRGEESQEWYQAAAMSAMRLVVTADELRKLNDDIYALLLKYGLSVRQDRPEGARQVRVTYRAFPAGLDLSARPAQGG